MYKHIFTFLFFFIYYKSHPFKSISKIVEILLLVTKNSIDHYLELISTYLSAKGVIKVDKNQINYKNKKRAYKK